MSAQVTARAALISAPASGQGKTTVTAALARHFRARGDRVTVFKTGPDFLDPMILERAAGAPVYQLDLFMGGEAHCRALLARAAAQSDVVLVEGVMGLYDGAPSSADLAARFGLPVIAVVDASAMAATFGALVHGLATYREKPGLAGAIANRVGSARHAQMLREAMPRTVPLLATLKRMPEIALPSRHLGLVQAGEIASLDEKISAAARELASTWQGELPSVVFETQDTEAPPRYLRGLRIAVAKDAAFSFLYPANLDLLEQLGATLAFFSPLAGDDLPACDAVYLPGGYPELHLDALARNEALKQSLARHHAFGKPLLAECGGLLYLLESLTDSSGVRGAMAGLLKGHAEMQPRLAALALQRVVLPEGTFRGHTFHHSRADIAHVPIARGVCPNGNAVAERVYRESRLTASYVHFYFPSNPEAAAKLFLP